MDGKSPLAVVTPVIVAKDQDKRHPREFPKGLVADIMQHKAEATTGEIPVDLMWTVDGQNVMFDLKTPADLIKSSSDGRLHSQMESMQSLNCALYGFIITGRWSWDDGWTEDQFEDTLLRLEVDGAKVTRCGNLRDMGRRIAATWRWTRDKINRIGSYHNPTPIMPSQNLQSDPPLIFYDRTFRSQVGMLMHLPRMGAVTANNLREQMTLMEALGITDEGLEAAKERWAAQKGIGKKSVEDWEAYIRS